MAAIVAIILLTTTILHTTSAWTRFTTAGKSVDYTRWFSEEGHGYSGRQTAPIAGLVCSGRYCDELRLITVREGNNHPVLNSWHWTRWFSEETPSWADCPSDTVVNEMQCRGRYCDDIRLQCGRLASGYRVVSSDIRQIDWFSEEQGERRCPDGYYLWGMACRGRYCDDLKVNCARVDYIPPFDPWKTLVRGGNTRMPSRWFSEEEGGYSSPMTGPVGGIACRGRYCDDKRLLAYKRGAWVAFQHGNVQWTGWFSEEGSARADCPHDRLVNEIQCRGRFCDDMRLGCARLVNGYRIDGDDTQYSEWFGSDVERFCPDGYYVRGIQCRGHYCEGIRLACRRVKYNDEHAVVPSHPRPVYIINHRANSVGDIEEAVAAGANAIECDVRYDDGKWYVDHDGAFFWSTTLSNWLSEARDVAEERGEAFALIIFDIKTPTKIDDLRKKVREALPSNLNTIFSVAEYKDRAALNVIDQGLTAHEGVTIDFDNDPGKVQGYFVGRGVSNFWYGNGICAPCIGPNVRPSLVDATARRDGGQGIKKTYVWTLAKSSSITDYFKNVKVDGVMVNIGTVSTARQLAINEGLRIAPRSEPAFTRF